MRIRYHRIINIRAPVMIAAWPGIGNIALSAVDYMRERLGMKLFAEIDMEGEYYPDAVVVEKGLAKFPKSPGNLFFYKKNPPLVILQGEAQLSGGDANLLMEKVFEVAARLRVRRIITAAAFPISASHNEPSKIYVAATGNTLLRYFERQRFSVLKGGQISGLNGLALGFSRSMGVEGVCLLATLPQYAINLPNPKASRAIVRAMCKILGITVDLTEMSEAVTEMDKKMEVIEDKMKDLFPVIGTEPQIELGSEKIPSYVMEKIERLFKEAKHERKKANELKQELDRWEIYKLYEDRFLDLFGEK